MPALPDPVCGSRLRSAGLAPSTPRAVMPPSSTKTTLRHRFLRWLAVVLGVLAAGVAGAQEGEVAASLFDPPDVPTEVQIQVIVADVDGIDSSQQSFTANVFFRVRWHDPSLAGRVDAPTLRSLDEQWHPHLQVLNRQKVWSSIRPEVLLEPDGHITMRQRQWGSYSQPLDLRDFPLDEQAFEVVVVSIGHRADQVVFAPLDGEASGVAERLSLSDWRILGHELQTGVYQPFEGASTVPSATFRFRAQRLRGYYMLKIVLPLALILGMSYLVYWVPMDQMGTRISVVVTSMLTLIAYRFTIGDLLPKISYMTRMDTFVMLSTILVFVNLLVVSNAAAITEKHEKTAGWLNRIARWVFPALFLGAGFVAFRF